MAPRRSHKKSRAGCRRCKSRKIKCDEARPRCANCDKHGVACDYECPELVAELSVSTAASATPRPTGSPPGAVRLARAKLAAASRAVSLAPLCVTPSAVSVLTPTSPVSPAGRLLELRLLHHFTTVTFKTLSSTNEAVEAVWRDFVPRAAFAAACGSVAPASNHLTDSILAIAALHLRTLAPHDRELVKASHAYMASSLSEYNALLQQGINPDNAVSLFLNAALISFQSAAARIFSKEEPAMATDVADFGSSLGLDPPAKPDFVDPAKISYASPASTIAAVASASAAAGSNRNSSSSSAANGTYGVPLSWFHAFQGVKTITAVSWQWLRSSDIVLSIINAQPPLHLDMASAHEGFFGHLLDDLDEELLGLALSNAVATDPFGYPDPASPQIDDYLNDESLFDSPAAPSMPSSSAMPAMLSPGADNDLVARTRHAYQHAVAVLNWAHSTPYNGACLVFPATVSRHFVELLGSRSHRAITILACFFAMLKTLDRVWWLQGMARREVLGIVSLFNSDAVPVDVERHWWPHLQWAVRVALYHSDDPDMPSDYVPPEVWGCSSPCFDECPLSAAAAASSSSSTPADIIPDNFVSHIDMISESISTGGSSPEFNYPSLL